MTGVALITGCSSGIGRETARCLHRAGWHVAATLRTPVRERELAELDGVFVTRLDVTDPTSIEQAVVERLTHTLATRPRELVLDRIRSALPDLDTTRSSP